MRRNSLLSLDNKYISNALKIRFYPMTVQAAKGTQVIDETGKCFLDLTAGWAVGLPLSTVVARKEILDVSLGAHLFTMSGNPISTCAAHENLLIIEQEQLMEKAKANGHYFIQQLNELKDQYEWIGDVRGRGLAIGVEIVEDRMKKIPAREKTAAICYRAFELGLLVFYVGIHSNVIEITPPLTISREEIDTAVSILDQSFRDLQSGRINMDRIKQYAGW